MNVKCFERLAVLMYLLASLNVASAQKITATMRGDVTDPSGAAVAGAKVVVRNEATNAERETATDDRGAYIIDLLPAGRCDVSSRSSGCREVSQDPHLAG
jgi:hypothetical protein